MSFTCPAFLYVINIIISIGIAVIYVVILLKYISTVCTCLFKLCIQNYKVITISFLKMIKITYVFNIIFIVFITPHCNHSVFRNIIGTLNILIDIRIIMRRLGRPDGSGDIEITRRIR